METPLRTLRRLGLMTLLAIAIATSSSNVAVAYKYTKRHAAWDMCSEFVRDRLKAPKTADFAEYRDVGTSVIRSGRRFVVDGYVDAENSFGANLRTQYICTVQPVGGDRWQLLDLQTL